MSALHVTTDTSKRTILTAACSTTPSALATSSVRNSRLIIVLFHASSCTAATAVANRSTSIAKPSTAVATTSAA